MDLSQAAYNYEDSADPAFVTDPGIRRRQLALAAPLLNQAESIVLQLLKQNPSNDDWKAALADIQVRMGTVEQGLNPSEDSATLSASGLPSDQCLQKPNSSPTSVDLRCRYCKHALSPLVWMYKFATDAA